MTRIPELGATLSVSKLDTALKERKSLTKRGRHTSQRKTERSYYDASGYNKTVDPDGGGDGPLSITDNSASSVNIAKPTYEQCRDVLKKKRLRNGRSSPDDKERNKNFGISSTAAKLSPRLAGSTEKRRIHSIRKADHGNALSPAESETQEDELFTDIVHGSDNDGDNDDSDDDDEEGDGVCGADGKAVGDRKVINVKSDKTVRPHSDSRISISQSRKEVARKTSLRSGEISHPFYDTTPRPPNHQVSRNSSRASRTFPEELGSPVGESIGSESNIRQIWRKELGLDVRPPRRHFAPKEYITGLAVGYPGQKAAQSQKTVTTTVVPTKHSLSEIQKRRKVLPPIDGKSKSKTTTCDTEKPPAPDPVKDINALAADLCRGASLETGNREAEAVYRTFRDARKHAFFDLDSDIGSARSKYLRPCAAPPNSDDEEGDGDETFREEWNDSSYTRIVRISSPENNGETVITHTVDASKVFDFGGRIVRKTQIDVFLPSELPDDDIQGGDDEKGSSENEDRENQGNGTEESVSSLIEQKHNNSREQRNRTNEIQREQIDNDQNCSSSEEDDEACDDTGSDERDESDDDDEDEDDN
ncbi:uncharacterized protein LOC135157902 [Lytechinus pictus]|uniref:uncharacterized protein LOC135157902 n=1 Tax=Lytechinus pictus TaxID=7653 RepID=UPI0030B9C82A